MGRMEYLVTITKIKQVQQLLDKLDCKNIFQMVVHSPSRVENYVLMGNSIRFKGELDPVCTN